MKMLICKNCKNEFEQRVTINNKRIQLKRPYCLKCSPYKSKQYIRLSEGYCKQEENKPFVCHTCKNSLILNEENFYKWKKGPSVGKFQIVCKKCRNNDKNKRTAKMKKWCVDYKGGKCSICNYDKCIAALDFHHVDPSRKDFNIANLANIAFKKNLEAIKAELDKCICVCSNCHRELHYKTRT